MEKQTNSFRWLVLILLFLNFYIFNVGLGCIPPLFSEIGKQIPLTMAQMGGIMGMGSLAALFFTLVGGALGDRFGCRLVFGLPMMVGAVFAGSRGFMGSPIGLYISMFLLGAAGGITISVYPKALAMWFPPQELGMANGIVFSSMGIGMAVAMGTSAGFLSPVCGGWRGAMFVFGGISLVMGILWVLLYRDPSITVVAEKKEQNVLDNFKKVFKIKDVWLLGISWGLCLVGLMSLVALLPVIFERRGIVRAGELVSIMMGTSVLFNISGGIISDKLGKRKPFLVWGLLVGGICILPFGTFMGVPLVIMLVLVGASLGAFVPVLITTSVEIKEVGPMLAGTAVGIILMIGNIGGFIGPIISGKLIDQTDSFWSGFIFIAASIILAGVLVIPVRETGRKRMREAII